MLAAGTFKPKWDLSHPFTKDRPKLLLVEGPDEWHVVTKILEKLEIGNIDARSFGGITGLLDAIETVKIGSGFDQYIVSLGVLRDAETDCQAAAQSIEASLDAAGWPVPAKAGSFAEGVMRIGYYICPDNASTGCLEDLIIASLINDPATSCVDDFCACLAAKAQAGELELDANASKIRLRAFLAARKDSTMQPAQAVVAYKWWEHEAWKPLVQFLTDLST